MKKTLVPQPPSVCNCINLRRASLATIQVYDRFLEASGLTVAQYGLLRHIRALGPLSVSDLADKMRLDRTTLVRNLKLLEEQAFIADSAPAGTRKRQLELTGAGARVLKTADPFWDQAQDYFAQTLGASQLKVLTALLSKIEAMAP